MTLVGTTLGRIRVVEALGRGGMGEVYAGYDEKLKRKVALKAIRDERRLDAEAKARFLREARILSQLDHPAICRIYELIESEDSDLLVLELIEGKSLKQAMAEDELDAAFKLHVAERVTEALVAAHARGVAHRDLKPENVMLTPEGGVKVLDFGLAYSPHSRASGATPDLELVSAAGGDAEQAAPPGASGSAGDDAAGGSSATGAGDPVVPETEPAAPQTATVGWSGAQRSAESDLRDARSVSATPADGSAAGPASDFVETQRGIVMGTVAYMAPEQARGERVTTAGDLYSLGLMLQELFTGRAPYEQGSGLIEMLRNVAAGNTRPVTGVDPDLAELYRGIGDYAVAESLYGRALEIQEQALGPAHPGAAITRSNLGDLYAARGELARAEPLYARALSGLQAALGPDHPSAAVTLNHQADLGVTRAARGGPGASADLARAESLYRRALEIQEQTHGRDHLSVAITLADLGGLSLRQGLIAEAERFYLRSQASTRQVLSENGTSRRGRHLLATVRVGLGRVYQASGAAERAAESWIRAAAIMEPLTAGSQAVALLDTHARALLLLGRVEEARPLAAALLATGWSHPDLLELCRRHGLPMGSAAVG